MPLNIEYVKSRPTAITTLIEQKFAVTATLCREHPVAANIQYRSFGRSDYYFHIPGHDISSRQLITALCENKREIHLLDIGTGNGDLLININQQFSNVHAIGISAKDMREPTAIPDEQYIVGNTEFLSDNPRINNKKFDCILSRNTFIHLTDPLGTLIQAYELLADDGILVIGDLLISGLNKICSDNLWLYLIGQDYKIDFHSYLNGLFPLIFIRKTKPHLDLPISYAVIGNELTYTCDNDLVLFCSSNPSKNDPTQFIKEFFTTSAEQTMKLKPGLEKKLLAIILAILKEGIAPRNLFNRNFNEIALFLNLDEASQLKLLLKIIKTHPELLKKLSPKRPTECLLDFLTEINDYLKTYISNLTLLQSNYMLFKPLPITNGNPDKLSRDISCEISARLTKTSHAFQRVFGSN